jgi:hypothetical protein
MMLSTAKIMYVRWDSSEICVGKWWNNSGGGNQKYSEKNLSQCHFVHHKFHLDLPGIWTFINSFIASLRLWCSDF